MNEEEKRSEHLNQYIEALHAEQSTADLEIHDGEEAALRTVARLLKIAAHPDAATPSPTFAAVLEKHLIKHHQAHYRRRKARSWWAKISANAMLLRRARVGAVITAILLAIFLAVGLPWLPKSSAPTQFSPFSLVVLAKAYSPLKEWPTLPGVLGDIELELATPLPASPQRMMLHRQAADPTTMEEAAAFAQQFGIQGNVFPVGASLVAENEHSRLEILRAQKGYYHYWNFQTLPAREILVDAVEAIRLAQHYLEQRSLLDFAHASPLVLAQHEGEAVSSYRILFPQIVNGVTIENAGVTVVVTKGGEVAEVKGRILHLEPVGQQPLLSGEAAYQVLQDPKAHQTIWIEVNGKRESVVTQMDVRQLEAPFLPSLYQPGSYAEIEGVLNVTVFQDASGLISYTQAFLAPAMCGPSLRLIGTKVDELASFDGYRVKISGLISSGNQNRLSLIVETYSRTHPREQAVVLLGSLEKEQDLLLLRSPEGTNYALYRWCQTMPSLLTEYSNSAWSGKNVLVRGILTGEQAAGKYPTVRIDQIHAGSEIEELESVTPNIISRLARRPSVVPASISVLSGQGHIEKADLILLAFPLPSDFQDITIEPYRYLVPAYRFAGHTTDGLAFTIYVQAIPIGNQ